MADESADRKLLDLLVDYCATHPSDDSDRFLENLRNAGDVWQPRESQTLTATETLEKVAGLAHPLAKPLVDGFIDQKDRLPLGTVLQEKSRFGLAMTCWPVTALWKSWQARALCE